MIVVEILVNSGSAWPHGRDRVLYGPFSNLEEAKSFFSEGVEIGRFAIGSFKPSYVNTPKLTGDYKELATVPR